MQWVDCFDIVVKSADLRQEVFLILFRSRKDRGDKRSLKKEFSGDVETDEQVMTCLLEASDSVIAPGLSRTGPEGPGGDAGSLSCAMPQSL
jgi:hypothetical protein